MAALRKLSLAVALATSVAGSAPPSEFRIFTAGEVETTKGTFVFDEAAAQSVMSEYEKHGIDLMIDYEHASLGVGIDPALSGKAAGWFNLELRNGELWAVNVRWTPAAAAALANKEWRYMSPAFSVDENDRITSVTNVAITNLPATRRLEPLVAASVTGGAMTIEEFLKVVKALGIDQGTSLEEAMAKIKGDPAAEEAPAEEAPAEAAALAEAPPAPAPADPEKKEEAAAVAASISFLTRLSGKPTIAATVAEIELWHKSHVTLSEQREQLAKERAAFEAAERHGLYVSLVTTCGKAPATVWADAKAKAPKKYLASMSIDDLREYVASERASAPKAAPVPAKEPAANEVTSGSKEFVTEHGTVSLSARELKTCAEVKADPQVYAANKAARAHKVKE